MREEMRRVWTCEFSYAAGIRCLRLGVRGRIQHGDAGIESATSEAQEWMRSPWEQQKSL